MNILHATERVVVYRAVGLDLDQIFLPLDTFEREALDGVTWTSAKPAPGKGNNGAHIVFETGKGQLHADVYTYTYDDGYGGDELTTWDVDFYQHYPYRDDGEHVPRLINPGHTFKGHHVNNLKPALVAIAAAIGCGPEEG